MTDSLSQESLANGLSFTVQAIEEVVVSLQEKLRTTDKALLISNASFALSQLFASYQCLGERLQS